MRQDDRDIYSSTRRERRARERTRSRLQMILIAVAVGLIGVAVVSFILFSGMQHQQPGGQEPSSAAAGIPSTQESEASRTDSETVPSSGESSSSAQTDSSGESGASSGETAASSESSQSGSASEGGHVEKINGQDVYVDTKHQAPETTGQPLTLTAQGETSYGFDWDYETDNKIFQLSCDYNFDTKTYNFTVYGVSPGTAHINVIYYTADNKTASLPVTIRVDDQLNVTREN